MHYIRELIAKDLLAVNHVPTVHQNADILIKPLPAVKFKYLRDKLRVIEWCETDKSSVVSSV